MTNNLFKLANKIHQKYASIFFTNIQNIKYANNVITKEISKYSPEMEEYKDQILKIVEDRYVKELNYSPGYGTIEEFLPETLILSINKDTNEVLAVSGMNHNYGANRVQMFSMKPTEGMGSAKIMQSALFKQLEDIFSKPNSFGETSFKLFEQFMRMYNFYVKMNKGEKPFELYIFPASEAVKLIPRRKVKVSDDGVIYQKRVVGAGIFTEKLVIGNSPNINGAKGYPSYEEASSNAEHKGQLIEGKGGGYVKVHDFNPAFWGMGS